MTSGNALKIDQMDISPTAGNPFVFEGVHSGGQLSGIEVAVTVYSNGDAHAIDELFERDSVTVDDPFTNRQYEAALHGKSSMYQERRPGKTYRFEVKELYEALQFEQLEIEGHTFTVIRNSERLYSKDSVIGLDILLRLSPEEFQTFQSLRRLGPITIRRVGIDESPIVRRFGGAPARNGPPSVPSVPRRITTFPTPSNPVGRYVSPTGTSPATAILMFRSSTTI